MFFDVINSLVSYRHPLEKCVFVHEVIIFELTKERAPKEAHVRRNQFHWLRFVRCVKRNLFIFNGRDRR